MIMMIDDQEEINNIILTYLSFTDNFSVWPTIHDPRIDGEHHSGAAIENTVVRHGDEKISRLNMYMSLIFVTPEDEYKEQIDSYSSKGQDKEDG